MKKYTVIIFCFMLFFNLSAGSIPTAAELLEKLEKCDLPECRVAVEWCGLLKVREAVPLLETLLEKKDFRYWRLKNEIVKALGKIGDPNSIGALLRLLPTFDAVSALNHIDRDWRYRNKTGKYYEQQLDKFYRNDPNKCGHREDTLAVLLVIDYDEQRIKALCLDVLRQKDWDLMIDAVDKLVELNAYDAVEPLLDILEELPRSEEAPRHYIYRYVNALDVLSPGWRESERGKAMGERIIREFKKRKTEFDRHIFDPEYAEVYEEYKKELESSGNNNQSHPHIEFNVYKGSREITDTLGMIQQVRLPSGIPLLLEIFQDEQELIYLRCQAAEVLGEIIEPGDTKTLRILINNLSHKQADVRLASVQALGRFGERFPKTVAAMPEAGKVAKELLILLKNQKEKKWRLGGILRGLEVWGDNQVAGDLLEILDKKLYPFSYDTLAIAVTLTHFNDPRILDTVVQLYNEAEESVKDSYIAILGRLKDRRALPILEKALQDKNRSVRAYAEWGIYHITQE